MLRYALAMCAALFAGNVQAADLPYGGSGPAATDLVSLGESVGRAGKTAHQNNAQKWGMMTATANIQLAQARSTPRSPQEQLRSLINGLGNGGLAYSNRIACMEGTIVQSKENNVGHFDGAPDVTVGQACRGLMEFSADATARGDTGSRDLLAPYRNMATSLTFDDGANSRSQIAAQALVNGFVNGSRDPDNANTRGVLARLDGQGKTFSLTPGAALDARFTQVVLGVRDGSVTTVPNRISTWSEEQVNIAVETCVRGNATLRQCTAIGQEVAAIYLSRPRSERQPR